MPGYNQMLKNISPSASMKRGLGAGAASLTNFAIGMPDLLPPSEVVRIISDRSAKNLFPYTASSGTDPVRKNLAHLLSNDGLALDAEEVIPCDGAKFGIYLALKALANPGERVLVLEPYWLSYPHILTSLGLIQESFVPQLHANGILEYPTEDVIRCVKEKNIRVLILNNPNNPSGQIMPLEQVRQLVTAMEEAGVWVIIDEVYIELAFDSQRRNANSLRANNLIRVGSFSKSLCIPGLRAGYIIASAAILANFILLMQHIQTCVNSFALSVMELVSKETLLDHSKTCASVYAERFETLKSVFKQKDIPLLQIESSFYAFADFSSFFQDSEKTCDFLLENLGLITTPGHEYGDFFRSFVRICLTQPENKIAASFAHLSNEAI
jgi:aspartate/methionine/tyrosine aminotransferase